jgi:hypothetical protein
LSDEDLIWQINHYEKDQNHYENRDNHYEKEIITTKFPIITTKTAIFTIFYIFCKTKRGGLMEKPLQLIK